MTPIPYTGPTDLPAVLDFLRGTDGEVDEAFRWPDVQLSALEQSGAMRWVVPAAYGGDDLPAMELHQRYEAVARASLTCALILTQRDSAAGLIDGASGAPEREAMLRLLARNEGFATVGIAQLTTSRQGGPPALRAEKVDRGWKLNGVIPWCTGAVVAQFIVAGAALEDGQQILFLLPREASGVTIDAPMPLVALRSSLTTSLTLNDVVIEDRWLLRGPTERALSRRNKSLHLGQAFLATGLCLAGLDLIGDHGSVRAREVRQRFEEQLEPLRQEIASLCEPGRENEAIDAAPRIRGACNDLALRIAHTAVSLYKGTALLSDHPAQRLAREAMFLLVWSCPNPVIDCTVDLLARGR